MRVKTAHNWLHKDTEFGSDAAVLRDDHDHGLCLPLRVVGLTNGL